MFVAFAHADAEEVLTDLVYLKERGYRIWYDEGIGPGTPNWATMIIERIEACAFVLVYLSPAVAGSEWVEKEIGLAISEEKELLIVHLHQTRLPASMDLDLLAARSIMKYEKQEAEYLTELLRAIPESCSEIRIIEPPLELDFKNEIEFRVGKAPKWSRALADELTQFAELLGLEPERAQSVLARTLKELGIDVEFGVTKEPGRSLFAFLSYRRESGAETARLIRSELRTRGLKTFLDVEDLGASHFDERLLRRIEEAPNFILVLSPGALDRCGSPNDWLRREIAHAITNQRNIVPILKEGFSFPGRETLPQDLVELPRYNSVVYSHAYFKATINRVLEFCGVTP